MKENISNTHDCYGCGVCSSVCARNIITIKLNKNGFYEPNIINPEQCTNCGLCKDVCAFNDNSQSPQRANTHSWAAWSNNEDIRRKCSSGGIGFEIGKQLIVLYVDVCIRTTTLHL